MRDDLTAETLRQILHYNPDTGVFTWIRKPRYAGSGEQAGSYSTKGYRRVKIGVTSYRAHRLAWFYMTGQWPVDQIDHINGIPDDNRFSNYLKGRGPRGHLTAIPIQYITRTRSGVPDRCSPRGPSHQVSFS